MASQLLNLFIRFGVFSDGAASQHPRLRDTDWDRQFEGVETGNDLTRRVDVQPGATELVATTARSLSQDATTQYTISQPDPTENVFRYRWVGGTNPVLRTARTPGHDATTQFTVTQTGQITRFTAVAGTIPDFAAGGVIVGDVLNIEDTTPDDVSPFNSLNQGQRTIVTVSATYVEVVNADGVAEGPITLGSRTDTLPVLSVYSAAGVKLEDEAKITATAFNVMNRGAFEVIKVTSSYFDIENAGPGVPQGPITLGAVDGIVFYPTLWKWCYVETDQTVSLRFNGDTSDRVELEPITPGDRNYVAVHLSRGPVYSLSIANNGLAAADVKIVLAE